MQGNGSGLLSFLYEPLLWDDEGDSLILKGIEAERS